MHRLPSAFARLSSLIVPVTLILLAVTGVVSGQNATFSYTGADQTYVVPPGITAIQVKLWGAGGGREGGSGAFVSGNLAVTPGETLTIIVGGGGALGPNSGLSASAYGGGGRAIGDTFFGPPGAGGGRSAIRRGSTEVVTAGAGGGGYGGGVNPGGGGGLAAGVDPPQFGSTGLGGTQTAGGAKAPDSTTATNGSQFQGGTGHNGPGFPGGPGGGSGYYGGGGGASDTNTGGAGGGSSYTVNLTSFVGSPGAIGSVSGSAPGGATDPSYAAGVGRGGSSSPNTAGGNGRVVFGPVAVSSVAPTVTTASQANITDTTALLGGNVTSDGGAALSARGVVISPAALNSNPQLGGSNVTNLPAAGPHGTGVFNVNASALTPSTQYAFAAYATNASGTGYTSPASTFTTAAAPVAVSSLSRVHATPSGAASVSWTLTFASAVTGVNASHFSLSGPAASGASVGVPVMGSGGLIWTIPVTTGGSDGLLTLNLANATGLSKPISTVLPYAGESYTMDKTPPQVLSVTRLSPGGQTTSASTVTFRVTYSEPVQLNPPEAGHFQVLPVGLSTITGLVSGVTGSGNIRDVSVNIVGGSGAFKLRVVD